MTDTALPNLTQSEVEAFFTRADGSYVFARWGRPIAPVVFGVDDATLAVFKGAIEALCALSGHEMTDVDPELGTNLMIFVFQEWAELADVPDLDRLVPDLGALLPKLIAADANQYRFFRFDEAGGIRACFAFVRLDTHLAQIPAETLALNQTVQMMLLWSDQAFAQTSPLAVVKEATLLRPEIAGLIRAAYDPVLPLVASDPSHALRLVARLAAPQ